MSRIKKRIHFIWQPVDTLKLSVIKIRWWDLNIPPQSFPAYKRSYHVTLTDSHCLRPQGDNKIRPARHCSVLLCCHCQYDFHNQHWMLSLWLRLNRTPQPSALPLHHHWLGKVRQQTGGLARTRRGAAKRFFTPFNGHFSRELSLQRGFDEHFVTSIYSTQLSSSRIFRFDI